MNKSIVRLIVYVAVIVIIVLALMIANNLLERENILKRISEWSDLQVKDFFAIRGVPSIYLYDHNGELKEFFRGAVGLEQIRLELKKRNSSD